ncbi:creatininase family protein [Promicromonospora sp. NPDC052451]|uniref:creatininase family protein n=1 Tax=Promicromonospora sp. NPDC052451 TaxID=3364407 RepID=UPI0037C86E55
MPRVTATDAARQDARIAVLPIGSFEQHGDHLPLATDTMVATLIAEKVCERYGLLNLPPVTISCSHEHEDMPGLAGTVSVSPTTLLAIVNDVRQSLQRAGIHHLVLVNAHGGNYALSNLAQEANVEGAAVALFPGNEDWKAARTTAGIVTGGRADMHAGELETSILMHAFPDSVGETYTKNDHDAPSRNHLTTLGMKAYTTSGVIGMPSLATAAKGEAVIDALVDLFADCISLFDDNSPTRKASDD